MTEFKLATAPVLNRHHNKTKNKCKNPQWCNVIEYQKVCRIARVNKADSHTKSNTLSWEAFVLPVRLLQWDHRRTNTIRTSTVQLYYPRIAADSLIRTVFWVDVLLVRWLLLTWGVWDTRHEQSKSCEVSWGWVTTQRGAHQKHVARHSMFYIDLLGNATIATTTSLGVRQINKH